MEQRQLTIVMDPSNLDIDPSKPAANQGATETVERHVDQVRKEYPSVTEFNVGGYEAKMHTEGRLRDLVEKVPLVQADTLKLKCTVTGEFDDVTLGQFGASIREHSDIKQVKTF